jgi:hypothetical protein
VNAPHEHPRRSALATSVILLIFVALYAATGYFTLDPASRAVPLLAALVTGGLIGVELIKRLSASTAAAAAATEAKSAVVHELRVLASIVAVVLGIYLVGFLVALPIYVALAIALIGRQPWRVAILTAAATTAAIYVAFEVVLSYRLFAGVVFS